MGNHEEALEAAAKAMCEAWYDAKIGTPAGDVEWRNRQYQYRMQAKAAIPAYLSSLSPDVGGLCERLRKVLEPFILRADNFDGIPSSKYFGDIDCVLRYSDDEKVEFSLGVLRHVRNELPALLDMLAALSAKAEAAEAENARLRDLEELLAELLPPKVEWKERDVDSVIVHHQISAINKARAYLKDRAALATRKDQSDAE